MEEGRNDAKVEVDGPVVEQPSAGDSPMTTSSADSSSIVVPVSPWRAVASLIDFNWWRSACIVVFEYAPSCIVPAVFSALSSAVVTIAVMAFYDRLRHNPVELTDLLLAMAVLLMGGSLGIAFLVLGFGGWLVRLGAFSILLVKAPSLKALAALSKAERKSAFKNALRDIEPKKIHIGGVLLWVSAYMLFPLFLVMGCTMVKMITMPSVMGSMALKLPSWIDYACAVAVIPNFLFLVVNSFVSLVVAACSPLKPQKSANFAFKLSWRFFWPLSTVSIFFSVLGFGLGAPSDLLQMLSLEKVVIQVDPNAKVISQAWSSVLSLVMFPMSFVPICDILRPLLREELLAGRMIEGAGLIVAKATEEIAADASIAEQPIAELSGENISQSGE
ncbi:MAG TPA: hypothetical protein EYN91_20095 [Candidatus Melainabacteria bacterium]|nr:hypothetical protein [Candidatus Melainabacteria bacterium]HIN65721.1 hypothetical protein [Candidatus Obscuribacterales bacterium]